MYDKHAVSLLSGPSLFNIGIKSGWFGCDMTHEENKPFKQKFLTFEVIDEKHIQKIFLKR